MLSAAQLPLQPTVATGVVLSSLGAVRTGFIDGASDGDVTIEHVEGVLIVASETTSYRIAASIDPRSSSTEERFRCDGGVIEPRRRTSP